ncbi:hypothetical protein BJ322DRAFT_1110412 [Thelephora terrestris]|uniref:DUF6533 domain-containing protein n=1 Tax=Thelephora terrestris TaxID=56493 RepID=A0A9P6HBV3_9AGAM|nr:hypothetical protein BJ322DRAFT_1110412 [Thelephora terrestris]
MDEAEVGALVHTGKLLFLFKLFLTSMHWLWIYDYFVTLGDELTYAWSGKKSWIFALFIANRYTPLFYLTWANFALFDYTEPLCTKWIQLFHIITVTTLAQLTVALRIYAVTGRNRRLGSLLLILISTQLCFGIYYITRSAMSPGEFFFSLFVPVNSSGIWSLAQSFSDIKVDALEFCIIQRWKLGELLFTNLVIVFGVFQLQTWSRIRDPDMNYAPRTPRPGIQDLLSFLIILVTTKKLAHISHPSVPSILDVILRGATLYFIFLSAFQVALVVFVIFSPEEIRLMPGVVDIVFVPIMASRLMLSLKKAANEPHGPWSVETMTDSGRATRRMETIRFASRAFDESHRTSETLSSPNGEDIELESAP